MKRALLIVGGIFLVIGLIWIGQGTGWFPYPSSSFMINQTPWIRYGAATSILGLILMVIASRR